MEKPTTKSKDVDVMQSHIIEELITNIDVSNKNVEKPTTSLISLTPPIHNQGTYVFNNVTLNIYVFIHCIFLNIKLCLGEKSVP